MQPLDHAPLDHDDALVGVVGLAERSMILRDHSTSSRVGEKISLHGHTWSGMALAFPAPARSSPACTKHFAAAVPAC
jgi:hypothetical protein